MRCMISQRPLQEPATNGGVLRCSALPSWSRVGALPFSADPQFSAVTVACHELALRSAALLL